MLSSLLDPRSGASRSAASLAGAVAEPILPCRAVAIDDALAFADSLLAESRRIRVVRAASVAHSQLPVLARPARLPAVLHGCAHPMNAIACAAAVQLRFAVTRVQQDELARGVACVGFGDTESE